MVPPPRELPALRTLVGSALLIFVLALALRVGYIETTVVHYPLRADAATYVRAANNLLTKGVFSDQEGDDPVPTTYITPGYPVFLAAIFRLTPDLPTAYRTTLYLQAVLGAATALAIFLLGSLLVGRQWALVAGALTALSPNLITLGGYVLTETLFAFLLTSGVAVTVVACDKQKPSGLALAGGILAAAWFVRPALLLFPVLLAMLIWWQWPRASRGRAIVLLALVFAGACSPWLLRNATLQAPGDAARNPASASFALGTYPNLVHKSPELRGVPYYEDPEFTRMSQSFGYSLAILRQRSQGKLGQYVCWYALGKAMLFWTPEILVGQGGPFVYPVRTSLYHQSAPAYWSLLLMHSWQPVALLLAPFALLALRSTGASQTSRFAPTILVATLLYFTAVHSVLAPLPRYSVPLLGILQLTAVLGLAQIAGLLKRCQLRFGPRHQSAPTPQHDDPRESLGHAPTTQ